MWFSKHLDSVFYMGCYTVFSVQRWTAIEGKDDELLIPVTFFSLLLTKPHQGAGEHLPVSYLIILLFCLSTSVLQIEEA